MTCCSTSGHIPRDAGADRFAADVRRLVENRLDRYRFIVVAVHEMSHDVLTRERPHPSAASGGFRHRNRDLVSVGRSTPPHLPAA